MSHCAALANCMNPQGESFIPSQHKVLKRERSPSRPEILRLFSEWEGLTVSLLSITVTLTNHRSQLLAD